MVAVSACGRNGGIGTPLASLLPGPRRERHCISDIAVNCVERERTLARGRDVGTDLELICTIGGVVLGVTTKLPQRRRPQVAEADPVFQRRRVSAVFGIPAAAGFPFDG